VIGGNLSGVLGGGTRQFPIHEKMRVGVGVVNVQDMRVCRGHHRKIRPQSENRQRDVPARSGPETARRPSNAPPASLPGSLGEWACRAGASSPIGWRKEGHARARRGGRDDGGHGPGLGGREQATFSVHEAAREDAGSFGGRARTFSGLGVDGTPDPARDGRGMNPGQAAFQRGAPPRGTNRKKKPPGAQQVLQRSRENLQRGRSRTTQTNEFQSDSQKDLVRGGKPR